MDDQGIVFPAQSWHPGLLDTDNWSNVGHLDKTLFLFLNHIVHDFVMDFLHHSFPKQTPRRHGLIGIHDLFQFHRVESGFEIRKSIDARRILADRYVISNLITWVWGSVAMTAYCPFCTQCTNTTFAIFIFKIKLSEKRSNYILFL